MSNKTRVTLVIGPAGTGKTHRCITEVCTNLQSNPAGPPLVFIAPKQATFQLERLILATPQIHGYTRLTIVSFEHLAENIIAALCQTPCRLLGDQGQIMVLRAILQQQAPALRVFHPTARLPGFALELSATLRELQQHRISPNQLRSIAKSLNDRPRLRDKFKDLALLFDAYIKWLESNHLHDVGALLNLATNALRAAGPTTKNTKESTPKWAGLWLDGFAELTPQEIDLLATLLPFCERATLAFCAESPNTQLPTWNSTWYPVARTIQKLVSRLEQIPDISLTTEILPRKSHVGRFSTSPDLALLEMKWEFPDALRQTPQSAPQVNCSAHPAAASTESSQPKPTQHHINTESIKILRCLTPQSEAIAAAREILRHVRHHHGRFRDVAVLVRSLTTHADVIRRVFTHYQIPFFLDRREPVSHHPMVELTRSTLRTIAFGWQLHDWMSVLKTELLPASHETIDRIENEALAHGWDKGRWLSHTTMSKREPHDQLQQLIATIIKPFQKITATFQSYDNKPSGQVIARAIRQLWADLHVDQQLADWSNASDPAPVGTVPPAQLHHTVWEQLNHLIDEVELAFANDRLDLPQWVAVLEAGFQNLTVGLIPPTLDQVLVGAIDRSRNPNLTLVIVLGLNASIFPITQLKSGILSEIDRSILADHGFDLTINERIHLAREKFLAYIAFTRASNRLVLTYAERDASERPLAPSPFISSLKRIFPNLDTADCYPDPSRAQAMHPSELIPNLIKIVSKLPQDRFLDPTASQFSALEIARKIAPLLPMPQNRISTPVAEQLYGPKCLRCSITALEQFAACPFQFFVSAGLRAQEREYLELDKRNVGTFLHEVLAEFHHRLTAVHSRWRDLEPQQARQLVAEIAYSIIQGYARDLFRSAQHRSLTAPALIGILEDFVEQCVIWMRTGYQFDPCAVEVEFGTPEALLPPWQIPIDHQHSIALRGKIDRVDICRDPRTNTQWCIVIDYKLSETKFNDAHLQNGLQMQLPAYLAAITNLAPDNLLQNTTQCVPAGMFYAPLRSSLPSAKSRVEALTSASAGRARTHLHRGRFRADAIPQLDRLHDHESCTGQFLSSPSGKSPRKYKDAMSPDDFQNLLASITTLIQSFGQRIFSGDVSINPCRIGASKVACDYCNYSPICRINRSKHLYRQIVASPQPIR